MDKKISTTFGAVLFGLTLYSPPASAGCTDDDPNPWWFCYDPWANPGTETIIGIIGTDASWYNTQWIGWYNVTLDECHWDYLADSSGLPSEIYLDGYYSNDTLTVARSGGDTICGYTLTPPIYNGHNVNFDSMWYSGGNDYLTNGTHPSAMYGSYDGTHYYSDNPDVVLYGDEGVDIVDLFGEPFWWTFLYTYGGNDNILLATQSGSIIVDCGSGNDTYCGPSASVTSCENGCNY